MTRKPNPSIAERHDGKTVIGKRRSRDAKITTYGKRQDGEKAIQRPQIRVWRAE